MFCVKTSEEEKQSFSMDLIQCFSNPTSDMGSQVTKPSPGKSQRGRRALDLAELGLTNKCLSLIPMCMEQMSVWRSNAFFFFPLTKYCRDNAVTSINDE